jgi:hypothetical protein
MVAGTYKSRDAAETAASALQSKGVPAAVLEIRDVSLQRLVRLWQVIVPRERGSEVPDPSPKPATT